MRLFSPILSLLILFFSSSLVYCDESIVQLTSGSIQGIVTDEARIFRGIPYAAPPVDEARWTPTAPISPWTGILPTKQDGAGCIQHCTLPVNSKTCPPITSEDCLFITVYTPRLTSLNTPAPILVFFHGGNFIQGHGGGAAYDGHNYANLTRTIIISVNYRLGAMGFLATGADNINGNFGIMDQVYALNWVQANGAAFGGDVNRVTIWGQSAGAVSVTIHLSLAQSQGLFHGAIIESTPYTIALRDEYTMPPEAKAFAYYINCTLDDYQCMRSASAADVLAAQLKVNTDILADPKLLTIFLPWTPHVDGQYVMQQPFIAMREGNYSDVPIIQGNTLDETTVFIYSAFGKNLSYIEYAGILDLALGATDAIKALEQYPTPFTGVDARPVCSQLSTDYVMICPNLNVTGSVAIANKTNIYSYIFSHIGSFNSYVWAPEAFCYDKVCHGSDLPFMWDSAEPFVNYTVAEQIMTDSIVNYFASFTHSGTPNGYGPSQLDWPAYDPINAPTMIFNTPNNYIINHFDQEVCAFWNNLGYGYGI